MNKPISIRLFLLLLLFSTGLLSAESKADVVPLDLSGVRSGPITIEKTSDGATIRWPDEASRQWRAEFSLDTEKPLLTVISVDGRPIVERARPLYWCETGKRRG